MYAMLLFLFIVQPPAKTEPNKVEPAKGASSKSENIQWLFKPGQEFFVEETQRHLYQVKQPKLVTSYFDFTYLWRYYVQSESQGQIKIMATLDKVRVNNPNEAGGRGAEALRLQADTRSYWILSRSATGWKIEPAPDNQTRHAPPYFLTLGLSELKENQENWKQQWKVPLADWGQADLVLSLQIKQRSNDRLITINRARLEWQADPASSVKLQFEPNGSSLAGMGEYDLAKNRWYSFEYRLDGNWQVRQGEKLVTMKQDSYCSYRWYERRPTFP